MTDEEKDWFRRRVNEVRKHITVFEVLANFGINTIPNEVTATQISCPDPEHGPDVRPSARYYPKDGSRDSFDHVWCFKDKKKFDAINLYGISKGLNYGKALTELEKRFSIKVPKKADIPQSDENKEKSYKYESESWGDIERMLVIVEKKLRKIREICPFNEYIKICRTLDEIFWDFKHQSLKEGAVLTLKIVLNKMYSIEEFAQAVKSFEDG